MVVCSRHRLGDGTQLLDAGLKKGDRIVIYLPMIIEAPVAMLAAARIGVPFTLVFSGFGANSLAERIRDSALSDQNFMESPG